MIPIEFRAYSKDWNQYFYDVQDIYDGQGEKFADMPFCTTFGELLERQDEFIIEQFTGCLDKNGQKIFLGDIILTPREDLGVVVYVAPFFEITVSATQSSLYSREWWADITVVGNINQNPELLK